MTYKLESQSARIGQHIVFELTPGATDYVIGLTWFRLSYGKNIDHHVDEMMIRLTPNRQGDTLNVHVAARLDDSTGHQIDVADSRIEVACISTDDPRDNMANVRSIGGLGGDSRPVNFGGGLNLPPFEIAAAVLAGFDYDFGRNDHEVRETSALNSYAPLTINAGTATSSLTMKDDSGNNAVVSGDAGVIVTAGATANNPASPLQLVQLNDAQESNRTASFAQDIGEAVAFITGFQVQYEKGEDHHVKTISAGANGGLNIRGSNVVLPKLTGAFIYDNSGNQQDNDRSSVTMSVFALPA